MIKLGVNIDHVATLRQVRGGIAPNPVLAALVAEKAGADGITVHLREDRRHIQDHDVPAIHRMIRVPLNLEMALHPAIVKFALKVCPEKVCIVPERRQELTTEGGLDAAAKLKRLKQVIPQLKKKGIEVSLFIAPSPVQIHAAKSAGADTIELHTGTYANLSGKKQKKELERIKSAVRLGKKLGLTVNAGHGIDYENVKPLAAIRDFEEFNIGHSIVSCAVFLGLPEAIRKMKRQIRKFSKSS